MINHLGLVTSNLCTNKCTYCYRGPQPPFQMSLDIAKKAIDETLEQLETPPLRITFLGGEPMIMFPKLLQPLMDYYRNYPIEWTICSNGQIAREEWLSFLSEFDLRFALSLDGVQKAHDMNRITKTNKPTWQTVMDNLPLLFHYFPKMSIQATFNAQTIEYLYESYLFHETLGFEEWYYAPDIYTPWPDIALQCLAQQLDKLVKYYLTSPESPRFNLIDNYLSKEKEKRGNARFKAGEHNLLVDPTGWYKISRLSAAESTKEIDMDFLIPSIKEANIFFDKWGHDADQLYYANQDERICKNCPAKGLCTTPQTAANEHQKRLALIQPPIQCYQKRLLYLAVERYKHLNEREVFYD